MLVKRLDDFPEPEPEPEPEPTPRSEPSPGPNAPRPDAYSLDVPGKERSKQDLEKHEVPMLASSPHPAPTPPPSRSATTGLLILRSNDEALSTAVTEFLTKLSLTVQTIDQRPSDAGGAIRRLRKLRPPTGLR